MSNLLPQQHKQSIVRMYRKRFLSFVFLSAASIFVVGIGLLLPALFLSKANETTLEKQKVVFSSHEISDIAHSLSLSISAINQKLGVFSRTVPASPLVGSYIEPILSVKGPSVELSDFTYELVPDAPTTARVRVSGIAQSRETLLAFTDRIKTLKGFSTVDLPIMSFIKNQNVTFTISAVITLQ